MPTDPLSIEQVRLAGRMVAHNHDLSIDTRELAAMVVSLCDALDRTVDEQLVQLTGTVRWLEQVSLQYSRTTRLLERVAGELTRLEDRLEVMESYFPIYDGEPEEDDATDAVAAAEG